jgi:hypothetical protein
MIDNTTEHLIDNAFDLLKSSGLKRESPPHRIRLSHYLLRQSQLHQDSSARRDPKMPSISNIYIELQGPYRRNCDSRDQKAGGPLEEFAPLSDENRQDYHFDGYEVPKTDLGERKPIFMPRVWDPATRTVSVFVPIHMGCQWWIAYRADPPADAIIDDLTPEIMKKISKEREMVKVFEPGNGRQKVVAPKSSLATVDGYSSNIRLFWVMKLYIGGAHVDTWSAGEDGINFSGKTHFALHRTNGHYYPTGHPSLMKRTFYFSPSGEAQASVENDANRKIEIRVHRAHIAFRCPTPANSPEDSGNSSQIRYEYLGMK